MKDKSVISYVDVFKYRQLLFFVKIWLIGDFKIVLFLVSSGTVSHDHNEIHSISST